jgi:superfamily II DNA or RNA helicase
MAKAKKRRGKTKPSVPAGGGAGSVAPGPWSLGDLDFLRSGIGIVHQTPEGPAQTCYVSRSADDRQSHWGCSCRLGRQGRSCPHLVALEPLIDDCHVAWDGVRSWSTIFERSLWSRLAAACVASDPTGVSELGLASVAVDGQPAFRIEAARAASLLAVVPRTAEGTRLLDRLGLGPAGYGEGSRARLLANLQKLQATDLEQAMNDRGVVTQRQALELSFYVRIAYHFMREHGDAGIAFHPRIDRETADFLLIVHDRAGGEILRLVLPGEAVESVLGILRAEFPEQEDLAVRPVPLRSLFKVEARTELDVEVRPMIEALQANGESRFYARDAIERFRYGRLVYLPELEVLAELERPGRERKFAAPVSMSLTRSQVPALVQRMEVEQSTVVDGSLQSLTVFDRVDGIEIGSEAREGEDYWASVRCRFGAEDVSLTDLLSARDRKLPYYEVRGGWVDLKAANLRPLWDMDAARDPERRRGTAVRLSSREALKLTGCLPVPTKVVAAGKGSRALEQLLSCTPSDRLPPPTALVSPLRFYQKTALDWLFFLHDNRLGGLLCDDMGLGKTHEVMAFLLGLVEHRASRGPFLVVCPTSVVSHWRDKLAAHAPSLPVTLYYGSGRVLPAKAPDGEVVLTSYGVLRNDVSVLAERGFEVAVFDEAQHVKNKDTLAYQAACEIEAPFKLGLSGTPIENDLRELKTLFDLVLPGYLGTDSGFVERYGTLAGPAGARLLQRRIAPFVLRRLKADVLDELPEKIEDLRTCTLSEEQRRLYRQVIETRAVPLREQLEKKEARVPYLHVFAVLNLLKRICDHPALMHGDLDRYSEMASGKWDLFAEILEESLDSGQKVVVFSQYLGMIEIMRRHLVSLGVGFTVLTGATTERGRVVERFNTDPECRVFLGSLKAGGTGIDLVAGSVVVHYDRWWNAAREDQATDRVHRIGQKRAVQVFKLVTERTLEERIAQLIEQKRQLLGEVIAVDDPHLAKIFSRDELRDLLAPL